MAAQEKPETKPKKAATKRPAKQAAARKAASQTKPKQPKPEHLVEAKQRVFNAKPGDQLGSSREQVFVDEYLVDLCVKRAAVAAGFSENSASSQGSRLLSKPEVQAAIKARMQEREARTQVTQDRVVRELARIAFGDLRKVVTWGPTGAKLRDSSTLSDDDAATVSEASETAGRNGVSVKVKTHDKVRALDLLCRHLGMLKDQPPAPPHLVATYQLPADPVAAAKAYKDIIGS